MRERKALPFLTRWIAKQSRVTDSQAILTGAELECYLTGGAVGAISSLREQGIDHVVENKVPLSSRDVEKAINVARISRQSLHHRLR